MAAINAEREAPWAGRAPSPVLALRRARFVEPLGPSELERALAAVHRLLEEAGVPFPAPATPTPLDLAGRDPACDLLVDGSAGWLALGGPAAEAVDPDTDRRHPGTIGDVEAAARLADALPQVGIVSAAVRALDVPEPSRALHEVLGLFANTTKHVQAEAPSDEALAAALLEIAQVVAGGADALRARPVLSVVVPIGPDLVPEPRLRAAATLAGAGVPVVLLAEPVLGPSAPPTLAGALVFALAQVLGAASALRARVPGARVLLGTRALRTPIDGRAVPAGSHALRFQMAWVQVAGRLGLPCLVEAFVTGTPASDWQAGMEGGLGATAAWMAAPDVLAGAGLRGGGDLFSPVGLLLDTEAFDLVRPIPLGFAVDEEALAIEVIERVGPGGHFLGEPHTLRHMRETWASRFMDRSTWEAWEEAGRPEPPDHARERARALLAEHRPTPLAPEVEAAIREVIAAHEPR